MNLNYVSYRSTKLSFLNFSELWTKHISNCEKARNKHSETITPATFESIKNFQAFNPF